MRTLKIILAVTLIFVATSKAYATIVSNHVNKARAEKKMLFLVCGEPDNTDAVKINKWIKTDQLRLAKNRFNYKYIIISTDQDKENLMKIFSISDTDQAPFVCVTDQNGNEFMTIKGMQSLQAYKKLVKAAKKNYASIRAAENKIR